jgi:hypothetical protein
MGPASSCKATKETARAFGELMQDDEFIDLGLEDWPVCEVSNDSPECSSPSATKFGVGQIGKESA